MHHVSREEAIAILERKLDGATLAIVRSALEDSDRLSIIRDAFLAGRDADAVQMIRDLDPIGIRKAVGVNSYGGIVAGGSAQLSIRPQLPFQATNLIVSPSCAADFMINDIRVGTSSMYVQSSDIAADLFTAKDILHGAPDSSTRQKNLTIKRCRGYHDRKARRDLLLSYQASCTSAPTSASKET
jgi:hypothetical protein